MTEETRLLIYEDYIDHTKTVTEIEKKYGVPRSVVARIAVEQGATPRSKKFGKKKTAGYTAKICPKCRKTIDVKGARFCYYCGEDIRTGKEQLIEKVENTIGFIRYIPLSERDKVQQVLLAVIEELKK